MKKMIRAALIFLVTCLVSAAIGWVSGYDFDYRSGGVALWTVMSLFVAAYLGAGSYLFE